MCKKLQNISFSRFPPQANFSNESGLYISHFQSLTSQMLDITARDVPNTHKTLNTLHASWKTQEQHLNYKRNIWHGLCFIFQSHTSQPVLELFLMLKLWTEVLGGSSCSGGHFILFESARCELVRTRAKTSTLDFKWGVQTFKSNWLPSFVPRLRSSLQRGVWDLLW